MSIFEYDGAVLNLLGFYAVFFAIGYAFVSALFPGRTALLSQSFTLPRVEKVHEISLLERIALSIALSAVTLGITGVLLTRVLGLNEFTVSLELLIFITFFTLLAAYRRASWVRDPFILRFTIGIGKKYNRPEKMIAVLVVVAAVMFVAVAADSLTREVQQENFTEFYLSNQGGTVESLPSTSSGVVNVSINIVSHMSEESNYTLIVSDGSSYSNTIYFNPSMEFFIIPDIGRSTSFYLESGEHQGYNLIIQGLLPGDHTIYFTLINDYETLQLWMPIHVPYSE